MGKSALDEIRARSGDDADGLSCFSVMAKTGLETGRGGARGRAGPRDAPIGSAFPRPTRALSGTVAPRWRTSRTTPTRSARPCSPSQPAPSEGDVSRPPARSSSQRPLGASRVASRFPPGPVAERARRAVGETLLDAPRSFTGSFDRDARAPRLHKWRVSRGSACLNSRETLPSTSPTDRPRSRRASILCFWANCFPVRVT